MRDENKASKVLLETSIGYLALQIIVKIFWRVEWQHLVHSLVTSTLDPKVDHRVGQAAAHVELQGQVVHALRVLWKHRVYSGCMKLKTFS